MSALPKTTSNGAAFNRGASFGTKGNETAAVPHHPIERGSAPYASKRPCYQPLKRTEFGTKPVNLGPVVNAGRDQR